MRKFPWPIELLLSRPHYYFMAVAGDRHVDRHMHRSRADRNYRIYLLMSRQFIAGLTAGAVKG